jgi:transcriptional regulator with XRE-family HTH domain
MGTAMGAWVKKNRISLDLTQTQLAEKIGVSQSQVSNWELGISGIGEKASQLLSSLFNSEPPVVVSESPLGEWVKERREQLKLTRTELARKIDMSSLALYYIETGRTESPREQTMRSLEAVLGRLPSIVRKDVKVEREAGELQFLGPFPISTWEENVGEEPIPCVYVLYDELRRPVRIGETEDLRRRLSEHKRDAWWWRSPTVDSFAYVVIENAKVRRDTERVMIKLVGEHAIFNIQDKL